MTPLLFRTHWNTVCGSLSKSGLRAKTEKREEQKPVETEEEKGDGKRETGIKCQVLSPKCL